MNIFEAKCKKCGKYRIAFFVAFMIAMAEGVTIYLCLGGL